MALLVLSCPASDITRGDVVLSTLGHRICPHCTHTFASERCQDSPARVERRTGKKSQHMRWEFLPRVCTGAKPTLVLLLDVAAHQQGQGAGQEETALAAGALVACGDGADAQLVETPASAPPRRPPAAACLRQKITGHTSIRSGAAVFATSRRQLMHTAGWMPAAAHAA